MNFFSQLNLKQVSLLKLVGLALLVMVVLAFILRLFGSSFSPASFRSRTASVFAPSMPPMAGGGMHMPSEAAMGGAYGMADDSAKLSIRNIAPVPPDTNGVPGTDAEQFEITTYHATIEARKLAETCGRIAAWKGRAEVIFERASESDRFCNYVFKVQRSKVDEILNGIKDLRPKELTENTDTIKRQVEDFTSEIEILEKKRASIEKTLDDAVRAYEEITVLATRSQDAASLARVIESKLQILERLTQEKLNINTQLDRLARAKAEQLDRLEYTYFSVDVFENKYIDGQAFKESWKSAVRQFVYDMNGILQDLSINLVALVFYALQYIIYFFIVLIIVKYLWKAAKVIWTK